MILISEHPNEKSKYISSLSTVIFKEDLKKRFISVWWFESCDGYVSRLMFAVNWSDSILQLLLLKYEAFSAMLGSPQPAVTSCLH